MDSIFAQSASCGKIFNKNQFFITDYCSLNKEIAYTYTWPYVLERLIYGNALQLIYEVVCVCVPKYSMEFTHYIESDKFIIHLIFLTQRTP